MKRPTFLTIWLILIAVADLYSLYTYTLGVSAITAVMPGIPSWVFPVYDALIVLQLISVVLLWLWKKVGFYLIVAGALVAAVLNVVSLGILGIGSVIFGVVGVLILYLAMRPAWGQFT